MAFFPDVVSFDTAPARFLGVCKFEHAAFPAARTFFEMAWCPASKGDTLQAAKTSGSSKQNETPGDIAVGASTKVIATAKRASTGSVMSAWS